MSLFSAVTNLGKNLFSNALNNMTRSPFDVIKDLINNYRNSAKDLGDNGPFGKLLSVMPGAVMANHVLSLAKDAAPEK
jgi:hypothetical protein